MEMGYEHLARIVRLLDAGKEARTILRALTSHFRDLLLVTVGGPAVAVELTPDETPALQTQARAFTPGQILAAMDVLNEAQAETRWNNQQRFLIERTFLNGVRWEQERVAADMLAKARALCDALYRLRFAGDDRLWGEFDALLANLIMEHHPAGATELHLVEELAGILWRKRRVLIAEGASINQGLRGAALNAEGVIPAAAPFEMGLSGEGSDLRAYLDMNSEEVAARQRNAKHDLEATRKASSILRRGGANDYEKALRALPPDSREWWQSHVEEKEFPPTPAGLEEFIREHLEPFFMGIEKEARHHDAIKAQTLGEGLQADRLEKLNRYETHLDRKFERTLAMLLKLKELRGAGHQTD
jgi:hypothetical protein